MYYLTYRDLALVLQVDTATIDLMVRSQDLAAPCPEGWPGELIREWIERAGGEQATSRQRVLEAVLQPKVRIDWLKAKRPQY
jgi:hypothetical protein